MNQRTHWNTKAAELEWLRLHPRVLLRSGHGIPLSILAISIREVLSHG
jgi:hypothetical protein